jgi:acetoin utilization protein AcuC
MSQRRLAFLYPPEIERCHYPPDCPFKTHRSTETLRRLKSLGLLGNARRTLVAPPRIDRARLELFHSPRYLDTLETSAAGNLSADGIKMGLGTPDTPVFPHLFEYGCWAASSTLHAADLLLRGEADIAFALPGGFHHAMAERAGGFCYLNDVALVCLHLAGLGRRVLCLDVDAHHGDGTQAACYTRRDVFTISLHESGTTLFPGTGFEDEIGAGEGRGFNVNVPLPAGTYDEAYLRAFQRIVIPLLGAYRPDVVVLELGMDTLAGDPLTHLMLTNNAHVCILEHLLQRLSCPLLVLGGGGYHVENTVRGWALAWQVCAGEHAEDAGAGLGGVFLGTTEWSGGLRDPKRPVTAEQQRDVDSPLDRVLARLEKEVFPLHELAVSGLATGSSPPLPSAKLAVKTAK